MKVLYLALLVVVAEHEHLHHVALAVMVEQVGDFAAEEKLYKNRLSALVAFALAAVCLVLLLGTACPGEVQEVGVGEKRFVDMLGQFATRCSREITGKAVFGAVEIVIESFVEVFLVNLEYHLGGNST